MNQPSDDPPWESIVRRVLRDYFTEDHSELLEDEDTQEDLVFFRLDHAAYYLLATPAEATHLDGVHMLGFGLDVGINTDHAALDPEERRRYDRSSTHAEQEFMKACDVVRASAAYQMLPVAAREKLEKEVLTIQFRK